MAFSQWWNFTASLVGYDRDDGAVYEFADSAETIVYIGSTNELKRRLTEHLGESTTSCIKKNTAKYRYEYTTNYAKLEQQLYDEYVRTYKKPPACNTMRPPG